MSRGTSAPNGSERVSQNGYHYTKVRGKWELTHRLVAEREILKRRLAANERVVFRNGDRSDIRPENLTIKLTNSDLTSLRRRKLELESRIRELEAQVEDINDEIVREEALRES
jgi:hypothetical protein